MEKYLVKDINLAAEGHKKINWVKSYMPVLRRLEEEFIKTKPFEGYNITLSIHLEAKTAYLSQVLKSGGANIAVTGSNPLSTQDDVAAALADSGINTYATYNCTSEEYEKHLNMALDIGPNIIIDDGGDLVNLVHTTRSELLPNIIGGAEETTTGILRLRAREKDNKLEFPMIAVNDAYSKYLFDNRYGTGQSVWDGIMRTTNLVVSGKNVVVIGYGWCGKGVAMRAKGLGARVIVCEIDPIKATEAYMDGFVVSKSIEAAKFGDFFVTVTGCEKVLTKEHFEVMKDGAILANAGHFNVEVYEPDLDELSVSKNNRRKNICGYTMSDGRIINLLAEGRLVNLAAGDGHPAEIMDMSFSLQSLAAKYLVNNHKILTKKVHKVTDSIDKYVAAMKLESLGIRIDSLTREQEKYLKSWEV